MLTLAGTVNTSAQRQGAAWATQRVNGVHGVANEWITRPAPLHQQSGTRTALAAPGSFLWHQIKALNTAEIEVEQSWMTPSGQIHFWAQRERAVDAARSAVGAAEVNHHAKVAAPAWFAL
ncbi:BON domain-containing protein [Deinococcus psychrotolerans]|uniref:BON domain-containing protein n=1 Tax=Deinococcus psychrotolerans TaxID=2489213 RepID=A0A3G8YNK6_9DEIO|nr:BON domain-containing protein [Deinococcus psychrotolerans]